MPNVEIPATGTTFHCAEDDTILRAALRAGLGPAYQSPPQHLARTNIETSDMGLRPNVAASHADKHAWAIAHRRAFEGPAIVAGTDTL